MTKQYEIRPYQEAAGEACLVGLKDTSTHVPGGILAYQQEQVRHMCSPNHPRDTSRPDRKFLLSSTVRN